MPSEIKITINNLVIGDRYPVRYMGILNLSPESFYKASVKTGKNLLDQAVEFLKNGADFLDIGGRSTAPTAKGISLEEEEKRVVQALETLFTLDLGSCLVSLDTQFTQVARSAYDVFIRHGQENRFVLNDVSCLCTDPELVNFLAETMVPVILMASHRLPGDSLGLHETLSDLKAALTTLKNVGYPVEEKVIIDPAIGHWIPEKKAFYDLELISRLDFFRDLKQAMLVGISRKSFISDTLGGRPPEGRYFGSLSATAIAVFKGAHILRVHEINPELKDMMVMAHALRGVGCE